MAPIALWYTPSMTHITIMRAFPLPNDAKNKPAIECSWQ